MKTLLKTIGLTAGMALVASVAHANADLTEDIFVTVGTGAGSEIAVDSSVTGTGPYTYTYSLSQVALDGGIDAFSVYSLGAPFTSLSISGITSSSTDFAGIVNGGHVDWSSGSNGDQQVPLSFSYTSPYAPTYGYTGAADGGTYAPTAPLTTANEVWVPQIPAVPDGGLTISLLGGTLLGLGALRRKLGC